MPTAIILQACELLDRALRLLDESGEQMAAIHVSHALELLDYSAAANDGQISASG